VSFDDIKAVAYPALRHRLVLNFEAVSEGITADEIIENLAQLVRS
jgi:MoxR-like ATPase